MFDPDWTRAAPFSPRHLRREVGVRRWDDGSVLSALDEDEVITAAGSFMRERWGGGGRSAAPYFDSEDERRVGEIRGNTSGHVAISLSRTRYRSIARSSAGPPQCSMPTSPRACAAIFGHLAPPWTWTATAERRSTDLQRRRGDGVGGGRLPDPIYSVGAGRRRQQ